MHCVNQPLILEVTQSPVNRTTVSFVCDLRGFLHIRPYCTSFDIPQRAFPSWKFSHSSKAPGAQTSTQHPPQVKEILV